MVSPLSISGSVHISDLVPPLKRYKKNWASGAPSKERREDRKANAPHYRAHGRLDYCIYVPTSMKFPTPRPLLTSTTISHPPTETNTPNDIQKIERGNCVTQYLVHCAKLVYGKGMAPDHSWRPLLIPGNTPNNIQKANQVY